MALNLKGKSFISLEDFNQNELLYLLNLATSLKFKRYAGNNTRALNGKNIVLLFDKPSTRTRCAFEVAAYEEGANVTFLSNSHMGHKESIEDTAIVLGLMYDGIEYRGYDHSVVQELAKYAGVPVWNGLTDKHHPTQTLATLLTIQEKLKHKALNKVHIVYVGDGRNNVCNSLIIGAAKLGMHLTILGPETLYPDKELIDKIKQDAANNKANIECSSNIEIVKGADVIYTDVWISMGEEEKIKERINILLPYQVNKEMLEKTNNPNVLFMHCLPAYHDTKTKVGLDVFEKYGLREMEVTDEVFRSTHSVVFEEAENRIHTIKAVMVATIN